MAAGAASWAGGSDKLSLGPGQILISTQINTAYNLATFTDLGGTDSIEFTPSIKKVGLKYSQAGDRDADKVVTAQDAMIKFGLAFGFSERLKSVVQGFQTVTDSSGYVTQIKNEKRLSERDSEILMWILFKEYAGGKPSTNPRRWLYFKGAPSADSFPLKYDATSQRFVTIQIEAYEESSVTGDNGNPCYWWSGIATGANRA